ncbi:MAG: hypothetical protein ABIR96_06605 [Bdellovibrionota bacterium]
MTQNSRLPALFFLALTLAACQGKAPSYTLRPDDRSHANDANTRPGDDLGEASNGDPTLWPSELMNQTLLVCENPRGDSQRSANLLWTTAGATERAAARFAFFKIGEKANVPGNLRRPVIASQKPFDILFEGELKVGPQGGLEETRTHLFLGSIRPTSSQATIWTVLPESRLELQSRARTLPAWVRISHVMRTQGSDWVLPAKSGSTFELFSKKEGESAYDRVKGLGLGLGDSFPVAAFDDAVIFQRNTGSRWSLTVVENLRGNIETKAVGSSARYVADTESDAFWAWTQNSASFTLNRYSLHSGSYSAETGAPQLKLAKPTLARRFVTVKKLEDNTEVQNVGWLVARDDLRKLQIYSEGFELKSEIAYPLNAINALSAEALRKASPVFIVEFSYGPGENRASVVHAIRSEIRGPLTQGLCARPTL